MTQTFSKWFRAQRRELYLSQMASSHIIAACDFHLNLPPSEQQQKHNIKGRHRLYRLTNTDLMDKKRKTFPVSDERDSLMILLCSLPLLPLPHFILCYEYHNHTMFLYHAYHNKVEGHGKGFTRRLFLHSASSVGESPHVAVINECSVPPRCLVVCTAARERLAQADFVASISGQLSSCLWL